MFKQKPRGMETIMRHILYPSVFFFFCFFLLSFSKLVAINELTGKMQVETFKFPTCCSCHVRTSPIFQRSVSCYWVIMRLIWNPFFFFLLAIEHDWRLDSMNHISIVIVYLCQAPTPPPAVSDVSPAASSNRRVTTKAKRQGWSQGVDGRLLDSFIHVKSPSRLLISLSNCRSRATRNNLIYHPFPTLHVL